jgi:hypothetical protein
MPNYTPIAAAVPIKASLTDLIEFQWSGPVITADFLIPDDDHHAFRLRFSQVEIVRILDEMPGAPNPNYPKQWIGKRSSCLPSRRLTFLAGAV